MKTHSIKTFVVRHKLLTVIAVVVVLLFLPAVVNLADYLLPNVPLGNAPIVWDMQSGNGVDGCVYTQTYILGPGLGERPAVWIHRFHDSCIHPSFERRNSPSTHADVSNPEQDLMNALVKAQQMTNAQMGALARPQGGDPRVPICRDDGGRTPEEKAFLQQVRKIALEAGAAEHISTVRACISDSKPHTLQIDSPDWCVACIANAFGEVKALIIRAKVSAITSIDFCQRRFAGIPCETAELRAEDAWSRPRPEDNEPVNQQTNPDPSTDWRGIEKRMAPLVLPPGAVIADVDKTITKDPSRIAAIGPKLRGRRHRVLALIITEANVTTGLKSVIAFYKSVPGYRQQPNDETVFEASFPDQQSSVIVGIWSTPGNANKTYITLNRKTYIDK